jgi:hypothetical protein
MKKYISILKVPCIKDYAHIVTGNKGTCRYCHKKYTWRANKGYLMEDKL